MTLDPDACYRAIRTRDARFDGRFFTAVRTTGIFCRPICPALPKARNCLFFPSAAAAQEAGYRPCLRCRPEVAPGTPAWLGTCATVSRAQRLIADGALDHGGVDDLAVRLGVGARHLRRLFLKHLGASPQAVAHSRRLLFAKQLIDETQLPMSQVAFASGFSSVRRFNDAVRRAYDRTPGELRRRTGPSTSAIALRLPYRPPYAWKELLAYLAFRAIPGVERVDSESYARTISIDGVAGVLEVRAVEGADELVAHVRVSAPVSLIGLYERLRRMFDLAADPLEIAGQLEHDEALRTRLRRLPGLRIPGAWSGFELAVRAILGQQVSVRGATTLAGRLAATFGARMEESGNELGLTLLSPTPEALCEGEIEKIGLPRARAAAIQALGRAVCKGEISFDAGFGLEPTVESLCALPGIGEWTAHYVAMRAFGEPDAFPAGDLGLRRALGDARGPMPERALRTRAEAWRPWRAYAAMALWQG